MAGRRPALTSTVLALVLAGCGSNAPAVPQPPQPPPGPHTITLAAAARRAPVRHRSPVRALTAATVPKPAIRWDPIPFGADRKAQMSAYVGRHYGSFMRPTWRLLHPRVIVIHYTESSYPSAFNTFANDVPDSELHELPATSAHFIVDTDGVIHQLVSVGTMARHTVGLNWTAIGVEHVGYSDAQVLGNRAEMRSSLRLVRWLRCRFHIPVADVIGHAESLSSPFHHEDEARLRTQTHSDFVRPDAAVYRHRLRALGGC